MVINFAQVEHVTLDNPITGAPLVFHDAPVAVILAIFPSRRAAQKHTGA